MQWLRFSQLMYIFIERQDRRVVGFLAFFQDFAY